MTPQKIVELKTKAAALTAELDAWTKVAVRGGRFEKHHSQVARIKAQIASALSALVDEIEHPQPATQAGEVEERILDLHRVWNFFRSKLVVHSFDHFHNYLALADELAYLCYRPVIEERGEGFREPPLIFFNEESSPYAMARDRSYAFAIPGASLTNQAASALLKSLPVPVVGIPWFQQGHLPDLAIVAHEVGHHVEDDLGLATELELALRNADLEHLPAWMAWRGEVFADVFATLALGRAFTFALFDFLTSTDAQAMTRAVATGPPWPDYPTAPLRIAITREVLDKRNTLDEEAKARIAAVSQHAMRDFEPDCVKVAKAFLNVALPGGKKIGQLIDFGARQELNASAAADAALSEGAIKPMDTRELVAAAVIAWTRNPEGFHAGDVNATPQDRIAQRIHSFIVEETRAIPAIEMQEMSVAAHREGDQFAGRNLLETLRGKTRPET